MIVNLFKIILVICLLGLCEAFNQTSLRSSRQIPLNATTTVTEVATGRKDTWGAQYYDFLINEGSFKFWSVFQLVTAAILIYSAFAAIYYAKYNLVASDYTDYDYVFGRDFEGTPASTSSSPWLGLTAQTFQAILNAISSKKYS